MKQDLISMAIGALSIGILIAIVYPKREYQAEVTYRIGDQPAVWHGTRTYWLSKCQDQALLYIYGFNTAVFNYRDIEWSCLVRKGDRVITRVR